MPFRSRKEVRSTSDLSKKTGLVEATAALKKYMVREAASATNFAASAHGRPSPPRCISSRTIWRPASGHTT